MNDLISRQAAIEAACNEMDWLDDGCIEERKTMIKSALSELPSAEADIGEYADRLWKIAYERGKAESESKTGEWVEHIGGISHELYYFCDQCYGEVDTNDYNYCPNCGAIMKGGDKE